jgi:hypothetical protein
VKKQGLLIRDQILIESEPAQDMNWGADSINPVRNLVDRRARLSVRDHKFLRF